MRQLGGKRDKPRFKGTGTERAYVKKGKGRGLKEIIIVGTGASAAAGYSKEEAEKAKTQKVEGEPF